jgi:predicted amidohydrolase YtcJ
MIRRPKRSRSAAAGSLPSVRHSDIQKQYTSQNQIDAEGRTIIPGMIDAHAHVMGLGQSLSELNLYGTTSPQQIAGMIAERVKKAQPGEWIRGRGWDQNDWGSGTGQKPFPTASMIDKVSPNNPVILSRIDGHAIWVNSKAMEIARQRSDLTIEVDGGIVIKDRSGNPTGVFVDNAESLIRNIVPEYTVEEKTTLYHNAFQECLRYGITGVHDMGIDRTDFEIYRTMAAQKMMPVRIYALVGGNGAFLDEMLRSGPYVDNTNYLISLRSIKLYLDGALGSRGAALIEPYNDEPESRGVITFSPDSIRVITELALQKDSRCVCMLSVTERIRPHWTSSNARRRNIPAQARNARLRIEHAQIIAPDDIQRFKQLNVIPSMQPTHATSDMYWAQARLGPERILGAYAWRSLIDDGNIIPAGSDFPVELPNPLSGFYAAVTRQDKDGSPRNAEDVSHVISTLC